MASIHCIKVYSFVKFHGIILPALLAEILNGWLAVLVDASPDVCGTEALDGVVFTVGGTLTIDDVEI